jgi:hypothetical protein
MKRRKFVTHAVGSATIAAGGLLPESVAAESAQRAAAPKKRVLFLAVDAMDSAMVERFKEHLPNIRRIRSEGYSGRVLPYVSCWGNMDFMSMMTGAAPGTQYRSRDAAGNRPRHQLCVAESIWQVLESEGRRSFLLNFPGSAPSKLVATIPGRSGPMVARAAIYQTPNVVIQGIYGADLESTGWPPGGGPKPGRRPAVIREPKPASGWSSLPASRRPPLEAQLGPWPSLIVAGGASGYDALIVYHEKNGEELARLQPGTWSPWKRVTIRGRPAMIRFRLLELTPDGQRLQLLQSAGCALDGFSEPETLASQLAGKLGPYWTGSAIPPTPHDPFWEVGEEEALGGAMWVANAAIASLDSWDWDFFLHKTELVDSAMHQCLTLADPFYYRYDPKVAKANDAVYRKAYIDLDRVVGRLLDAVARRSDTVLVVASDHGGGVNNTVCDINQRLRDVGLLAGTDREIDWAHTSAYTKRDRQGTEIYINLQGREPRGTVKPEDYARVQETVIDALLDWREPATKKRAVAYALKLRDAALIGYWGREAGDVQFCYNPGFVWGVNPDKSAMAPSQSPVSNHGPQIVTASTGYSSMMGHLLAWGPGVARGVERDEEALGPIPIASVAPTLSRLLGCRIPKDCQLGVLEDMLA